MNTEVNVRWKKIVAIITDISPLEQNVLKRDFIQHRLAPLVQDVFDASILTFNNYELIPTRPDGKISRTMQEISDTRRAIIAGRRSAPPSQGAED